MQEAPPVTCTALEQTIRSPIPCFISKSRQLLPRRQTLLSGQQNLGNSTRQKLDYTHLCTCDQSA